MFEKKHVYSLLFIQLDAWIIFWKFTSHNDIAIVVQTVIVFFSFKYVSDGLVLGASPRVCYSTWYTTKFGKSGKKTFSNNLLFALTKILHLPKPSSALAVLRAADSFAKSRASLESLRPRTPASAAASSASALSPPLHRHHRSTPPRHGGGIRGRPCPAEPVAPDEGFHRKPTA